MDVEGKYLAFLDEQGAAGMITRPDFYVFGGVAEAHGLPALVDELIAVLAGNGVQVPAEPTPERSRAPRAAPVS